MVPACCRQQRTKLHLDCRGLHSARTLVFSGHAKLQKPLKDVGITAEACLTVMDTLQDLEFEVTIHHINCSDPSEFVMAGDVDAKASAPQSGGAPVAAQERYRKEGQGSAWAGPWIMGLPLVCAHM